MVWIIKSFKGALSCRQRLLSKIIHLKTDILICSYLTVKLPTEYAYHSCRSPHSTHWGRVTHICVGNLTIIGSDNVSSPSQCQAIICTNAGILLILPSETNFGGNLLEMLTFLFRKMRVKASSAKWLQFCLGLNVLKCAIAAIVQEVYKIMDSKSIIRILYVSIEAKRQKGWYNDDGAGPLSRYTIDKGKGTHHGSCIFTLNLSVRVNSLILRRPHDCRANVPVSLMLP